MDSGCGVDFIVFHIGDWIQHLGERCLEHPSPLFKTKKQQFGAGHVCLQDLLLIRDG